MGLFVDVVWYDFKRDNKRVGDVLLKPHHWVMEGVSIGISSMVNTGRF